MNDVELTIKNIEEIIAASDLSRPIAERSALFAAISVIVGNIDRHIEDDLGGDGYALEKSHGILWHVGAALGFDIANGHDSAQHRSWAYGELSTLSSLLTKG